MPKKKKSHFSLFTQFFRTLKQQLFKNKSLLHLLKLIVHPKHSSSKITRGHPVASHASKSKQQAPFKKHLFSFFLPIFILFFFLFGLLASTSTQFSTSNLVPEEKQSQVEDPSSDSNNSAAVETLTTDTSTETASHENNAVLVNISIDQQTLQILDQETNEILLEVPIVSGNLADGSNTPTGNFEINSKQTNITLQGSDFSDFVYYWMAFIDAEYGIHDASWRDTFGGDIYKENGSHGCINLSVENAQIVFNLVNIGTPVNIY